jgi:hypothetical protein
MRLRNQYRLRNSRNASARRTVTNVFQRPPRRGRAQDCWATPVPRFSGCTKICEFSAGANSSRENLVCLCQNGHRVITWKWWPEALPGLAVQAFADQRYCRNCFGKSPEILRIKLCKRVPSPSARITAQLAFQLLAISFRASHRERPRPARRA